MKSPEAVLNLSDDTSWIDSVEALFAEPWEQKGNAVQRIDASTNSIQERTSTAVLEPQKNWSTGSGGAEVFSDLSVSRPAEFVVPPASLIGSAASAGQNDVKEIGNLVATASLYSNSLGATFPTKEGRTAIVHNDTTTFPYVYEWTGGGASNLWSDENNWIGLTGSDAGVHKVDRDNTLEFAGNTRTTNTNDKIDEVFEIQFNSTSNFNLNFDSSQITGQPSSLVFASRGVTNSQGGFSPGNPNVQNINTGVGTLNFNVTFTSAADIVPAEIDAAQGDIVINGSVNVAGKISELDFNGGAGHTATVNGDISGTANVAVNGGTALLMGANTISGSTTINGGILNAAADGALGGTNSVTVNAGGTLLLSNSSASNRVNDAAPITLNGGTIQKASGVSEGTRSAVGFGALTLTQNSTLDFTSSAGILTFTSFSPGTAILNIANYQITGSPNGPDQLLFNENEIGRLASFNFGFGPGIDVAQSNVGNGFYEIYALEPVPEPATWLAGGLAAGLLICSKRRSRRKAK